MVDARRKLSNLDAEWSNCTACLLGQRRQALGTQPVLGEGTRNGVMFIGAGPNAHEEAIGSPFQGTSSSFLRDLLDKLKFNDYYLTNLVICRSCELVLDSDGIPVKDGKTFKYRDSIPLPAQIEACRPRLLEEIYIVDPVIIVALGVIAAEALIGKALTLLYARGSVTTIEIPGATHRARLTEKKKEWGRKINGVYQLPVDQNTVRYLVLPTYTPYFALKTAADMAETSEGRLFTKDIKTAINIYNRYTALNNKTEDPIDESETT